MEKILFWTFGIPNGKLIPCTYVFTQNRKVSSRSSLQLLVKIENWGLPVSMGSWGAHRTCTGMGENHRCKADPHRLRKKCSGSLHAHCLPVQCLEQAPLQSQKFDKVRLHVCYSSSSTCLLFVYNINIMSKDIWKRISSYTRLLLLFVIQLFAKIPITMFLQQKTNTRWKFGGFTATASFVGWQKIICSGEVGKKRPGFLEFLLPPVEKEEKRRWPFSSAQIPRFRILR